jgi:YbbR domain-containing protein
MKTPWPFDHFGLKTVSVALAVGLWMAVSGEETVERGLRVPLEFQQFPVDLEVQGDAPTLVDIRVRGASGALARVSPGDIVAVLDLRGARPGRRLFQLTPEQVRAPFGLDVVQVAPATIALEFENASSRRVPIVPSIEGDPAPGFIVGAIATDPPEVEITGPETAVSATTEALTEAVSVAGARETVTQSVTVGVLNPTLRVRNPRMAVVQVQIVPGPHERLLSDQPVQLRGLRASLSAKALPAAVAVLLRGTHESVGGVSGGDVTAFVDLGGLGVGDYTLPVRVETPPAAGAVRIDPATVQVRINSVKN